MKRDYSEVEATEKKRQTTSENRESETCMQGELKETKEEATPRSLYLVVTGAARILREATGGR